MQDALLIELLTEELPPKSLQALSEAFAERLVHLLKEDEPVEESSVQQRDQVAIKYMERPTNTIKDALPVRKVVMNGDKHLYRIETHITSVLRSGGLSSFRISAKAAPLYGTDAIDRFGMGIMRVNATQRRHLEEANFPS